MLNLSSITRATQQNNDACNLRRTRPIFLALLVVLFLSTISNLHLLQNELHTVYGGQRSLSTATAVAAVAAAAETNNTVVNSKANQTDSMSNATSSTTITTDNTNMVVKSFNRTNPHSRTWCPNTKCLNSPLCAPCNRRYLFIIATGRSGSTTLLKMFNSLPNVRLSGENWNILYHASHLRKVFDNNPKNFIKRKTMSEGKYMHDAVESGPFTHNAMPLGSFSCVAQKLLEFLNPPSIHPVHSYIENEEEEERLITGAKMIRLQRSKWTPVGAHKFLTESFPCARFLLNIRSDLDGQARSISAAFGKNSTRSGNEEMTGADEDSILLQDIQQQTDFLRELANRFGDEKAKLIDMDDWKDDVSVLNEVLHWLGFENCAFDKVAHENYDTYGHDDRKIHLGDKCQYPHV